MGPARARSAETEEPRTEATAAEAETGGAAGNGGNATEDAEQGGGARATTLNLPFVTLQFRKPDLHLPRMRRPDLGAATGAAAAKARSLSPAELAYYAGLGALAAFELIEWPVALVVGAGTALARGGRNGGGRPPGQTDPGSDRGTPERRTETGGQD